MKERTSPPQVLSVYRKLGGNRQLPIGIWFFKSYPSRVKFLFIGVLAAILPASSSAGLADDLQPAGVVSVSVLETNAIEKEYQKLSAADDAAQAEVDKWVAENTALKAKNAGLPDAELRRRIRARLEPIERAYTDFLARHPGHAKAHLSYGCFLNDRQDEAGAQVQWEKALELDPKNAAAYNNLAGRYSETGPASKAFEFFSRAIALNPSEAAYYHNFGNTLFVLRKNAMGYYGLSEQQAYAKALQFYSNAVRLDPQNFTFACDFAQTYVSIHPLPVEPALSAWTNALRSAHDEPERTHVHLQLARIKMLAGRFAEARAQLESITNHDHPELKAGLLRTIAERENSASTTNVTRPLRQNEDHTIAH